MARLSEWKTFEKKVRLAGESPQGAIIPDDGRCTLQFLHHRPLAGKHLFDHSGVQSTGAQPLALNAPRSGNQHAGLEIPFTRGFEKQGNIREKIATGLPAGVQTALPSLTHRGMQNGFEAPAGVRVRKNQGSQGLSVHLTF